jgi:ATP-dependent RNA helicase DDX51/DBP6
VRFSLVSEITKLLHHRQVVDEADRLLAQSFQGWLPQVLAAARPQAQSDMSSMGIRIDPISLPQPDATAPGVSKSFWSLSTVPTDFDEHKETSCQKLLFSATLTRDPAKLAALELRDPQYFVIQGKPSHDANLQLATENFSMPATLTVCYT